MDVRSVKLAILLLVGSSSVCSAQPGASELTAEQAQPLIDIAQEYFWGNAVGEDGEPFHPADEAERAAPLIPQDDAVRVINYALPYGHALWCDVDYFPAYSAYMNVERSKGRSEKEMAFIGLLFGIVQGQVESVMGATGETCSAQLRQTIEEGLSVERERLQAQLEAD